MFRQTGSVKAITEVTDIKAAGSGENEMILQDTRKRSLAKSAAYMALATGITMAIGYWLTHKKLVSSG